MRRVLVDENPSQRTVRATAFCEDNMSKIPFEKQVWPADPVGRIEHKIAQGEPVSGDELLDAIEQSEGHSLADRLRDVVRKFSVSAVARRGRPRNYRGREDFAFMDVVSAPISLRTIDSLKRPAMTMRFSRSNCSIWQTWVST
jgi:hypothetical protein